MCSRLVGERPTPPPAPSSPARAPTIRGGANHLFNCLDVYHTPPDSGELQYKSRICKRRFDPSLRSAGSARSAHLTTQKRRFSANMSANTIKGPDPHPYPHHHPHTYNKHPAQEYPAMPCCRANMAHIRQSRPDSGLDLLVKVLKPCSVVPSSLGSGPHSARTLSRTSPP